MPLHDWADLEGWDGMHQLWIVELFHWIKPRLPAGYRAYIGTVPTMAVGIPGRRPDIHVRQGSNPEPRLTETPHTGVDPDDEPDVEIAVATLDPSKAVYVEKSGCLISALELISPGNKDCDAKRATYATRYAGYLIQQVNLMLVDVHRHPLKFSFADRIAEELKIPNQALLPAPLAISYRVGGPAATGGSLVGIWRRPLAIGQTLPIMKLPLSVEDSVSVDLEQTYARAAADAYLT